MIVVAIIGILAAVAIPAYTDYMKKSKVAEAYSLMAALKTDIGLYQGDQGSWPTIGDLPGVTTEGKYVSAITIDATAHKILAVVKAGLGTYKLESSLVPKIWNCKCTDGSEGDCRKYAPKGCVSE
jgi:type IV pilus assembly protein PilA